MNVIFSKADGNDALMPERDNEKQEGETYDYRIDNSLQNFLHKCSLFILNH